MKIKYILYLTLGLLLCSCKTTPKEDEANLDKPEQANDNLEASNDPINQGIAWNDKQNDDALQSCVGSGNPEGYCRCSIDVLSSLFSYSEFKNFDTLIRSGNQPPPEVISRMVAMGQRVKEECQPLAKE